MLEWLRRVLWRFGVFLAFTLGLARGLSWILGEDAKVLKWATANRPITVIMIVLSFIVYAMYDLLREK